MTEQELRDLEALAERLKSGKRPDESWSSCGGIGDKVTGIRVIRNGQIIQEWKDAGNS